MTTIAIDLNRILTTCTPQGPSQDGEWLIYMLHSPDVCVLIKAKPVGFVKDRETKIVQRRFLMGSWMHVKESHE